VVRVKEDKEEEEEKDRKVQQDYNGYVQVLEAFPPLHSLIRHK